MEDFNLYFYQQIKSVTGYIWSYILEINGIITAFVIKEKANPFDGTIREGKLEVWKTVAQCPVEGCVSDSKLRSVYDEVEAWQISFLRVQALKKRDRRTFAPSNTGDF